MSGEGRKGRLKAHPPSVQRDGFAWAGAGVGARLHDYLYDVVPPGLRRQQMMRYMLIGFAAEHGIRLGKADFVPPAPVEAACAPSPRALDAAQPALDAMKKAPEKLQNRIETPDVPSKPIAPAAESSVGTGRAAGAVKPGLFAGFKG